MIPAISDNQGGMIERYDKSFQESMGEEYTFYLKSGIGNIGTRFVHYDQEDHSLLISFIYSNRIMVLNLINGTLKTVDYQTSSVRSIMTWNGNIISSSWDGSVAIIDNKSLFIKLLLTERQTMGRCPHSALSTDGRFLYSFSYDTDKQPDRTSDTIRMWSLADGTLQKTLELPGVHLAGRRCGSCEENDGKLFVISDNGFLQIYNTQTGEVVFEDFYDDQFQSMCKLPSFNMLAFAGGSGHLYLCDLNGRRILQGTKAHRYDVTQMMLHPTRHDVLITVSFDGTLKFWHLPDLELINTVYVNRNNLWSVTAFRDVLITGGEEGDTWVYNIRDMENIRLLGKFVFTDGAYTLFPENSNLFYSSDPTMLGVSRNPDGETVDGQLADYLLGTCNSFKVFSDIFAESNSGNPGLRSGGGFFQLQQ